MHLRDAKCIREERECKNRHPLSSMHFSTAEGAHLCEPTAPRDCHLGAPCNAAARPPVLRQATATMVLRATHPCRIKLPSRSSALLVSVVLKSRPRYAVLMSLLRCVLLCPRRVEIAHSHCPPRPRPPVQPLAYPRAHLLL
jgi:hypothetical protein